MVSRRSTGSVAADQRPRNYRPVGAVPSNPSMVRWRPVRFAAMTRRAPTTSDPEVRTPHPRLARIIIGAVLAGQALYAGVSILGDGWPGLGTVAGLVAVAFLGYVAAIVVYLVGIPGTRPWLRPLAMGIAAAGLAIAAVRVAGGHSLDDLLFGMGIDGLLLYGLRRPDIRGLYPA